MPVDFSRLQSRSRGRVVLPDSPDYDGVRQVWNASIQRHPAAILQCAGAADVREGVRFAAEQGLTLAVRAGGHNVAGLGTCDDGLVLDLRALQGVRIDPAAKRARVQAGVTWGVFDHEAQAFGLATPGGVMSTTGIAGFTLGGGFGWISRRHGTASDNLRSVDIVTASGDARTVDAESDPELFWGLRGGGGNFGVATSFEYALHDVGPEVVAGPLIYPMDQAHDVLSGWAAAIGGLRDEAMSVAVLRTAPPDPPFPEHLWGQPVLSLSLMWIGAPQDAESALAPLRSLGRPAVDAFGPKPYTAFQKAQDRYWSPGAENYWKADYLTGLDDAAVGTLVEAGKSFSSPASDIKIVGFGGVLARTPEDFSAYGNRSAAALVNINTRWTASTPTVDHVGWTRDLWDQLHRLATGVYVNFLGQEGANRVFEAYGAEKFRRLTALKATWDPENFFHVNQNIPPRP
ncbi:FAD-binding oxidoreductase [Sinomonas sp. ASV486]|uniref:FAD-binding oxidoreductase n=1 Tax=Sinomonas sp. ASV486 TaxID=3051170 RepID=UPI0027DB285E|nr:FAD-binding oxidoreductase [Sinomonas sp. ASV486]MDQ4489493.1 FAD-binding oxidoreductase [Sinomonas sp. ASV486]